MPLILLISIVTPHDIARLTAIQTAITITAGNFIFLGLVGIAAAGTLTAALTVSASTKGGLLVAGIFLYCQCAGWASLRK